MSGRFTTAREAHFDRDLRVIRSSSRKPGQDHELAVAPIDLERRDRAATVVREKVADQTLQVLP